MNTNPERRCQVRGKFTHQRVTRSPWTCPVPGAQASHLSNTWDLETLFSHCISVSAKSCHCWWRPLPKGTACCQSSPGPWALFPEEVTGIWESLESWARWHTQLLFPLCLRVPVPCPSYHTFSGLAVLVAVGQDGHLGTLCCMALHEQSLSPHSLHTLTPQTESVPPLLGHGERIAGLLFLPIYSTPFCKFLVCAC